jgi:hypothetical protein
MTSEEENANQSGDWNDFAIQRSWNSAVAEYEVNSILHCNRWADRSSKKYHSIAKSGKPLEEVLTKEEHEALLEAGKMAAYASPNFITDQGLSHVSSKLLGLSAEDGTAEHNESIGEEIDSVEMKEEGELDEDEDEPATVSGAQADHVEKPQPTEPSQMQQATSDASATATSLREPAGDSTMSHGEWCSANSFIIH